MKVVVEIYSLSHFWDVFDKEGRIPLIKKLRQITDLGLADSKAVIDTLIEERPAKCLLNPTTYGRLLANVLTENENADCFSVKTVKIIGEKEESYIVKQ